MPTKYCRRRRTQQCCAVFVIAAVFYGIGYLLVDDKIRHNEDPALLTSGRDRVLEDAEVQLPTSANLVAWDGIWQNVTGAEHKLLVFSAYYERRDALQRGVRVVGVTRTHWSAPVWCRFWYDHPSRQSVSVLAHVQIIRENWDREYSACFFVCPLSEDVPVPDSVSVVRRLHDLPANRLQVIDNYEHPVEGPGKLAVCVQPLHTLHDTFRIIEFIELYTLLGVEHFTLYDNNTDAEVACVLDSYVLQGRVTLLPWDLPLDGSLWLGDADGGPEIWVHGIHAALNDCLYRNMYRYANLAMVDLDEFIVPKMAETLVELLDYMDDHLTGSHPTGSYNFRNAFFYRQWPDDPDITDAIQKKLLTATKTQRTFNINPFNERSKYICKPPLVVETGNHFIWQYVTGAVQTVYVEPDLAMNQHYRDCEKGMGCSELKASVTDRTAHRFKDILYLKVVDLWMDLKDRCRIVDFNFVSYSYF